MNSHAINGIDNNSEWSLRPSHDADLEPFGKRMRSDDVDLHLRRLEHGWSTAQLWVNGKPFEFTMTHIFGDPLEPLVSSASHLSRDLERITFDWQDEPGCYKWTFARVPSQCDLFTVDVALYRKSEPTKAAKALKQVTFTTELRFWKALVYSEAAKIRTLLTYTPYRDERRPETFPHTEFQTLEHQVAEHGARLNDPCADASGP